MDRETHQLIAESERDLAPFQKANGKRSTADARKRFRSAKPTRLPDTSAVAFEMDAAKRLIDQHGENLRYVKGLGWLVWGDTHWKRDEREQVRELVKQIASGIRREAARANDDKLWKFAKAIGSARGVNAVLDLARSDPQVRVGSDELDAQPHLLACMNGTIDLRTGDLRKSDRADLLTRFAPTRFKRDAMDENFTRILEHLIPNEADRDYMQRAAGYSLFGKPIEDVIFLLIGPPRAGEGTLLRAIREALGEHFAEINMHSFCLDRSPVDIDLTLFACARAR